VLGGCKGGSASQVAPPFAAFLGTFWAYQKVPINGSFFLMKNYKKFLQVQRLQKRQPALPEAYFWFFSQKNKNYFL